MAAKQGDIVRFLNSVGGGLVTKIKDGIAYVEDEDGFETPVLLRECVVVGEAPKAPKASVTAVPAAVATPTPSISVETPRIQPVADDYEEELDIEETPGGDSINLVVGFEPVNPKEISTTSFDGYLVNDSNYYLYFSFMTHDERSNLWTTRYAGVVEPNIQLFIGQLTQEMLPYLDRLAVQYIAFKRGKEFELKKPRLVEHKVVGSKFARLHCFKDNEYFDVPVMAYTIVADDEPFRAEPQPDARKLEKMMKQKASADRRPVRRNKIVKKQASARVDGDKLVVDLHINELVDNTAGLSNADMLNMQIDEFARIMDENLKKPGTKIVFIHGKGDGVLRNAIMKELTHRYKGHDVQDASFHEYGFGATQVTIKSLPK